MINLNRFISSAPGHVYGEQHVAMPTATEFSAPTLKIAIILGRKSSISWMTFRCRQVNPQLWNQEAMWHIVGDEMQLDSFTFLDGDFRRFKGKSVCVNLDDASRPFS